MIDADGRTSTTQVVEAEIELPTEYMLTQNYPNPFNPSTKIDYQLPLDAKVTVELYSISGERVATLVNNEQSLAVPMEKAIHTKIMNLLPH